MKRIGVMTTGGDAPGMNAAIRAVVRTAIYHGREVLGIKRGYYGLIEDEMEPMKANSVSGIINKGGTILHTVRCPEFKTEEGRRKAIANIKKNGMDGLVVIGGDGSFHGARLLNVKYKIPAIGVPATIDNDIAGTDYSVGFDTAVNTAMEAIDKIRDTAESHERIFVIEVMGREHGYLALEVGVAVGAECILIPEVKHNIEKVCKFISKGRERGKRSSIIVTAEGAASAMDVGKAIEKKCGLETRISVIGHIQRGGVPTALSRVIATKLGSAAVEVLLKGGHTKMVGLVANKVVASDISHAWKYVKKMDLSLLKLTEITAI